eukprot:Awhi_evm1s451
MPRHKTTTLIPSSPPKRESRRTRLDLNDPSPLESCNFCNSTFPSRTSFKDHYKHALPGCPI